MGRKQPASHKLSKLGHRKLDKNLCVTCKKAPRDGISPRLKRPYRTCAECRVKGAQSKHWWQLLVDGVLVLHWLLAFDTKFEGFALEAELQRWAFEQVDPPGDQFAATATSPRRRPLVNQQAQYPDPDVTYPCPDSGVVCVVEIGGGVLGRGPLRARLLPPRQARHRDRPGRRDGAVSGEPGSER
jgi:hypothetical protein